MIWKERKGLLRQRGSGIRALLTFLVPVAVVAIYIPITMGREWTESYWSLLACFIVPVLLVGIAIPDSIAGERERHTLSTLLASRLSDRAILFGKMAVAIIYALAATIAVLLLASITVNIADGGGQILFYSARIILIDMAFCLLFATFMAGLGVLISLRAATVQEAQQILMAAIMFPPMVLGFVVIALRGRVSDLLGSLELSEFLLIIGAVFLVASVVVVRLAITRFRRERLILS